MKKLNQVFQNWKPNILFTSKYLTEKNIYPQLVEKYIQSKWLSKIGNGAYIKYGDEIDYFGALYSIQSQLKLSIYIGGKTALSIHGLAHYITETLPYIELYALNNSKLPVWFLNYNWNTKIVYSTLGLFGNDPIGIEKKEINSLPILISSPERAIFELLNNIPNKVSFDEAYKIMESLYNLRPSLINKLLWKCTSIKVKRLFLYLSEKANHSWLEDLDLDKLDLGKGKREIMKEGILDKKYLITVPKSLIIF